MSNWIKEEAERNKQKESEDKEAQKWQIHKAQMIEAKGPELWRNLVSSIKQDVATFNESFPNDKTKHIDFHEVPSKSVILRKSYLPAVTVEARIDTARQVIEYSVTETWNQNSPETPETRQLDLAYEKDGNLYVRLGDAILTIEQASAHLLDPILKMY